jgi:hypothetical protein
VNRWVPAGLGLAGVTVSVVAADVWAARTRRPTISRAVAHLLEHPVGGPAVIAALAALGWHLSIEPIIRRLEAR